MDTVTVNLDTLLWTLDRLQEAGLQDTPGFKELEECAKQVRWELMPIVIREPEHIIGKAEWGWQINWEQ